MTKPVTILATSSNGNGTKQEICKLDSQVRDAEALYLEILSRTNSIRKKKNLKNVWDALQHLRAMRSQDFSIASVARAIQALDRNSPKEQTIRNSEGKDYCDLIRLYESIFGKKRDSAAPTKDDELVYGIQDLRAAAIFRSKLHEVASLTRRNSLLHNELSKRAAEEVAPRRVNTLPTDPSASTVTQLTLIETSSMAHFLNFIGSHGADLDLAFHPESGALLWRDGVLELATAGFRQALSKMVKSNG